ncbi:pyridoxal-phosphate dependent enzyme [Thalassotalea sp. LPB0316]|uniref:1-aminocyclopropane-1-carboxylate deaminase/D-cysteine desulfhydrase n=1 Tax=Thalassotalea sp. LPB0316 TaxID=2769490 RepID=UPI0018663189|nr:pyridoxal-phosphate dependent enzyme [Thalassotalea sp. LPB0316]QOL26738.1 pyridoxal-phosphate dependent enzyme [Thalassotalea sp. LPB0316]
MSTPSPITQLFHPLFERANVNVFVKRDDLIHPIISGNKWRKLAGNIARAKQLDKTGILSFGGAYSNHLHALAFACSENSLKSIGIIRGEPHYQNNATLKQAAQWGMQCLFVDRQQYRLRQQASYLSKLQAEYPDYLIVPEGGTNELALSGVAEVITELNQQLPYHTIITPVGSAGTISGLIKADNNYHNIIGICVLKGAQYLNQAIQTLLADQNEQYTNWHVMHQFHRGGYAKFSAEDAQQLATLNRHFGVTFEPVYSGKMLLAFMAMVEQGYFAAGQRIVLLHTGGLQGINGLLERKKLTSDQWPWQLVQ